MTFLDKLKTATAQATVRAKEELEVLQTKRELSQAYGDLGRKTFALVSSGQVTHTEFTTSIERIKALQAELEASVEPADVAAPTDPPAST